MDLGEALATMVGDVYPDHLVVGRTRDQLVNRFGYIMNLNQTSTYNRFCYDTSPNYRGKEVLFLRSSNWMVVMHGGKATDLVLLKGC